MELSGRRSQGVEFLLAAAGLARTTHFQGRQAVVGMDDQLPLFTDHLWNVLE